MKSFFNWILKYLSKIQIAIILLLVLFTFFLSESNVFAHFKYSSEISGLNKQIKYYKEQREESARKLSELKSGDWGNIEKFARENYLMKRDNEDVFIIENNAKDD